MLQEWACLGDDVARAAGVVVAQTGCPPFEALRLMRSACDSSGRTIDEIAVAVIERKVRFDRIPVVPGSMASRHVAAYCVEVGAGDSALNVARDRASSSRGRIASLPL